MKKIFVVTMLLVLAVSAVHPINVEAAGGCGNYEGVEYYTPECDDDGCGFLWLKKTEVQRSRWKRTCVTGNNEVWYETIFKSEKLGCC